MHNWNTSPFTVLGLITLTVLGASCGAHDDYEPGGTYLTPVVHNETPPLPPLTVDTNSETQSSPPPLLFIVDTLKFTSEDPPGTTIGFDLDNLQSVGEDAESCFHKDFVAPDGQQGIDNQFAVLAPLFDFVGFGALEGLIQGAIEDGGLLLVWEVTTVGSSVEKSPWSQEGPVEVTMRQGQGVPLLGTNGRILPGQTFAIHPDSQDVVVPGSYGADGYLHVGPFDITIPVVVFGVLYKVPVLDAYAKARVLDGGVLADGVLGGGVPIDALIQIAKVADGAQEGIYETVQAILSGMGDLPPIENNKCTRLSAALEFSAVQVFFFEDPKESL